MTAPKMPEITKAEILEVKPGDIIALSFDQILSDEQLSQIRHQLKVVLPDTRMLILEKGMKIQIVREEDYVTSESSSGADSQSPSVDA